MSCTILRRITINTFLSIKNTDELKVLLSYDNIQTIRGYKQFDIKKKNNSKTRIIYSPNKKLKEIQKKLNDLLQEIYKAPKSVHAYIQNNNIKTNAQTHIKNKIILNTDLEDFFPSIHYGRIKRLFMSKPFNFNKDIAKELTLITTYKNQLPQGAPTSPILSNMICLKLDISLLKLAKKYYFTYTRYADDMTFSFKRKINIEDIWKLIEKEIINNGFQVNIAKTKVLGKNMSQVITGLKINEFLNVNRAYIRQLNSQLHAWEKYNYDKTEVEFLDKYYYKHSNSNKNQSFINILYGRINYLRFIRGESEQIYVKIVRKYNMLYKRDYSLLSEKQHVNFLQYTDLEDIKEKLFVIDCDTNTGTGFILKGFPYLITCAHVIADSESIKIINFENKIETISLIKQCVHRDIALLSLPTWLANKKVLYNSSFNYSLNEVSIEQEINYYGFPSYVKFNHFAQTKAHITRVKTISLKKYYETNITIKSGNSGGPACLSNQQVIGMCTNGDHTLTDSHNLVLFIDEIIKFIQEEII